MISTSIYNFKIRKEFSSKKNMSDLQNKLNSIVKYIYLKVYIYENKILTKTKK